MADTDQFPATTALRRQFPTLAGFKITKAEPENGYREEEEILDEIGDIFMVNGIDKTRTYAMEMVVLHGTAIPEPLTMLVFTAPTGTNAATFPGIGSDGKINVLIRGKVKQIGDAGKVCKIAFTGMSNVNLAPPAA